MENVVRAAVSGSGALPVYSFETHFQREAGGCPRCSRKKKKKRSKSSLLDVPVVNKT